MATFSATALLSQCDAAFPSAGAIGYLTLLSGTRQTDLGYTVAPTTDTLTTATTHKLVTGSRIQMALTGVLPTPLLGNNDYYAIVVSPTTLKLASTLTDATAGTAIDLIDAGSGTLSLIEQALTADDSLAVLVNKEVVHPSWARAAIDNLGAAVTVTTAAQKPAKAVTIDNTSATPIEYEHVLIVLSPTASAVGSAPAGVGFIFESAASVQSIASGTVRSLVTRLRVRNA